MNKQYFRNGTNFLKKVFSVLGVSSLLLVTACDVGKVGDAVDDFKIVVSLDPINTAVAGQFVDVTTGELIEQDVKVTFTGQDGDQVVDIFSEPLGDLTITDGLMTFGISNEAKPSKNSPVKVNILAEAKGYASNSYSLTVDEQGNHQFLVYMKPEDKNVEGSKSATQNGSTGNDGSISSDLNVETSMDGQNGGTMFTISAGTKTTDAGGNTLSGNLQAQINHFNPESEMALRLLPGDLPVSQGKTFTPVTFNNFEMVDEQGRKAKSFSNDVNVSSRLPEGLINPNTGQPYKAGQTIHVFSFSEQTGEWVSEGRKQLVEGDNGNGVQFKYKTNHFSNWMIGSEVAACEEGSVFNINWQDARRDILVRVTPETNVTGPRTIVVPATATQIRIPALLASLIPQNIGVNVEVLTATGPVEVGPGNIDLCGQEYNIDIPVEDVMEGEVRLSLSCPSPDQNVNVDNVPTSAIYYRQQGVAGQPWFRFNNSVEWDFDEENNTLEGGSLQVYGLIDGATYTLKTVFDGQTYATDILLSSSDPNFVENGNGTFTYTFDEQIEGDLCN